MERFSSKKIDFPNSSWGVNAEALPVPATSSAVAMLVTTWVWIYIGVPSVMSKPVGSLQEKRRTPWRDLDAVTLGSPAFLPSPQDPWLSVPRSP